MPMLDLEQPTKCCSENVDTKRAANSPLNTAKCLISTPASRSSSEVLPNLSKSDFPLLGALPWRIIQPLKLISSASSSEVFDTGLDGTVHASALRPVCHHPKTAVLHHRWGAARRCLDWAGFGERVPLTWFHHVSSSK